MTASCSTLHRRRVRRWLLPLCLALSLAGITTPKGAQAIVQSQQLAFAGLHSQAGHGSFNAVAAAPNGNLYLLLDQKDGVRILETDATATTVLAQTLLGAAGDLGLALTLDPTGNVYVVGTSTSGQLAGSAGAAFPTPTGTSTNTFVARLDSSLHLLWLSFGGSGAMVPAGVTASASAVYLTGSIFTPTLPVTASAIQQVPASGNAQSGFVEAFSASGSTLLYATYLSGSGGNTAPAAIAVDAAGDAYVAGSTSSLGFPTVNALVPEMIPAVAGTTNGFLTQLTPQADALLFSTYLPGGGINSLVYDAGQGNLLLSGSVALGGFPVGSVPAPLVPTTYQVLLRLAANGGAVVSADLIAPGTSSVALPDSGGGAWIAGSLTTPLLPLTPLSDVGNSFAAHVTAQHVVDQVARFGAIPTTNPSYAVGPVTLNGLALDPMEQPVVAGAFAPTASSSLLATQTYDLPLLAGPTPALPDTVSTTVAAPGSCSGSLCPGYAGYLAKLNTTAAPALALSYDEAPWLTLRNLGSAAASNLQITSTSFGLVNTCGSSLGAGATCSIVLTTGSGPGTVTLQAANATTQTVAIPALTAAQPPIVFSPRELDFGIQSSTASPATRTLTVTNPGSTSQTFSSRQLTSATSLPYALTESASDCPSAGAAGKLLAAGGSCHITLALAASSSPGNDGIVATNWGLGAYAVPVTGYTQAAGLSASATTVDFGTVYAGGLSLPRYLYLSNVSGTAVAHAQVALPTSSPFNVTDRCPATLLPGSVCQMQLGYHATQTPSYDATTLTLDQGIAVLVTGKTLPQPGINGAAANPNLTVSPTAINFANAVVVTTTSTTTQTVTIGNTGAQPFPLALQLTGDFTDATNCTSTLAAGATCSVVLTFAPTQPGTRQGLLSVTGGAGTTPVYVTLTGTGTPILSAANGTVAFGNTIVGQPVVQWFKITQPFSTLTATTSGSADFTAILVEDLGYGHGQPAASSYATSTTSTCSNCWLGLQFDPALVGAQTASVSLSSTASGLPSTLTLTGTGLPLSGLILSPLTQDFGSVPLHSVSAPVVFSLINLTANATPITFNSIMVNGDFQQTTTPTGGASCSGTLAPNATCLVTMAFAPAVLGSRTGALTLNTSAGTVVASLAGFAAPDPGLALNPTSLTFSNVPGSTSVQQTITLTNTSNATLQVGTPAVTSASFTVSSGCSALAPAGTCTLTVNFTPGSALVSDVLTVPVTANLAGNLVTSTYPVPLSGAYTTQDAGLQLVPDTADYGPNPTSTVGITRLFTLNNLTSKALYVTLSLPRQFALTGPGCAGLAPNASCTFSVSFVPLTNATITGTLFAQGYPTDGSASVAALGYFQGYGIGANALALTGTIAPGGVVNFGQVASGQSASQTVTLTNHAAAPVTVRRVTSEWPFLATSTCGQPLATGQSCTVTVQYTPLNQVATGTTSPLATTDSGTLVVESDALSSPQFLDLAGSAGPVAVNAPSNTAPLVAFTASQSSLTFPPTLVGNISAPQTVTLANTGTATLHILNVQSTPDFNVTSSCSALIPGASCNLIAAFAPQGSGTRLGAIEISSDASTALEFVSLIGSANPSSLALAPASLNFGTVLLGSTASQTLQVTNTGATPVNFSSITATGDYAATSSCLGTALAASTSCSVTVTFTPTQTGTRTGSVAIVSDATTLPLTAQLTGVGAASHLQLAPSALDFGSILVGSSAKLTLTLTNTGNGPVTGLSPVLPAGDFAITSPCASTSLGAGASCTLTLSFTPSTTGPRSAALTVTSSDSTSPDVVPLSGSGVAPGSFTLTVGTAGSTPGSTAAATVAAGKPASYALTLTPIHGFSGTVVLNCSPIQPGQYATCSLLPSSITLAGAAQSAVATINTITSISLTTGALQSAPPATPGHWLPSRGLQVLPALAGLFLLPWVRSRRALVTRLLAVIAAIVLAGVTGCGSGGDASIRVTPPGTYQYQVTASSTSGVQITQSVTLNLTVQ
ncbi:MAG: choice-of-anchor D domain-containing protein [Acidobacteriota bacterium]|nr:choice-of-anchor D domain-containing protein [Acidobacteriota bacterium]